MISRKEDTAWSIRDGILQFRTNKNEEWKSIKIPKGQIEQWLNEKDAHVYCLYHIDTETAKQAEYYKFSDEILNEWDHFVLIHNPRLFGERLTEKLNLLKLRFSYGIVEYYNEDENQNRLSLFNRRSKYKYQNEFRFVVRAVETGPIQFEIGSLKDIAEVFSVKDVQGLRFLWP